MLATSTRIALANPADVLKPLCEHLVEHEAVITEQDGTTMIALDGSLARIELTTAALDVHVEAPDLSTLLGMKRAIASHVIEFAPKDAAPEMRWTGDGTGPALPPEFRILTVTGGKPITMAIQAMFSFQTDIGMVMAMTCLSLLPAVAMIWLVRNHIAKGFILRA